MSNDKGKGAPATPAPAPEPPRNAKKSMAFLIECDPDGLWTLTHCRPHGTLVPEAIKAAATQPPTPRDALAMASALIGKAIFNYQELPE